jgi:hypothetical protein
MPTAGTPWRVTKRKSEDDRDTDDARTKHKHASPSSPGTGKLVDKEV